MSYYVTNENSVLNINNAHLRVSGNVITDVMKLGAIEFAPSGSTVGGTVNFTNVTTGVTTSSNLSVGGTLMLGSVEVVGTPANGSNLHDVVELGNVTSNTVQFTNATTGFVTTANVEVGGELAVSGNVAVDTDTLFVDSVNDRVGVGTTSPLETLDVYGGFLMRPERTTLEYVDCWLPANGNNVIYLPGVSIDYPTAQTNEIPYSKNAVYKSTGGLKVSPPNSGTEYYYKRDYFFTGLTIVYSAESTAITSPYLSGDVFSSTRFKADNTEDFTGFAIGQDYRAGNDRFDYSQDVDISKHHSAHMYFKTASPDGTLTEKMRILNNGNVGIGTNAPGAELHVAGTGAIIVPSGTTVQQPTGVAGMIRFNTTTGKVEYHTGTTWLGIGGVSATGGAVTTADGYTIHTFTSSGTFTVVSGGEVEYLVVAGGGGGGSDAGGGGGAGGMLTGSMTLNAGTYTITRGAGGSGGTGGSAPTYPTNNASSGSDSVIINFSGTDIVRALGGGLGGMGQSRASGNQPIQDGGSGGGGGGTYPNANQGGDGGLGTSGQGNNGSRGLYNTETGGGGGGAGGPPPNSVRTGTALGTGQNGGPGRQSDISGTPTYYAGGGGGGAWSSSQYSDGLGGIGGGGGGGAGTGSKTHTSGQNGTPNTGGGGGGGTQSNGGNGGSGIVIIRYLR